MSLYVITNTSQYQCQYQPEKSRLQNNILCVVWDVKLEALISCIFKHILDDDHYLMIIIIVLIWLLTVCMSHHWRANDISGLLSPAVSLSLGQKQHLARGLRSRRSQNMEQSAG